MVKQLCANQLPDIAVKTLYSPESPVLTMLLNTSCVIRLTKHEVAFSTYKAIPLMSTNLPGNGFTSDESIFLDCTVLDYHPLTGRVVLRINGRKSNSLLWFHDRLKVFRIKTVFFENPEMLARIVQPEKPLPEPIFKKSYTIKATGPKPKTKPKPIENERTEVFYAPVNFDELTFEDGFFVYRKHFKLIADEIEIRVPNPNARASYNLLKIWFERWMGKKRFKVIVRVKIKNREVLEIENVSDELSQFSPKIIATVNKFRTAMIASALPRLHNGLLLTFDELFTDLDLLDRAGNVFNVEPNRFLNITFENHPAKKDQVLYLIQHFHSSQHKMYFSAHPKFGFVFCCKVDSKMVFI